MKSPFPGMDPYIEACGLWEGFHNRLIAKIDETLAQMLPRGYVVDSGVRSYVVLMETEGKREKLAKPDVAVTSRSKKKKPRKTKAGVVIAEVGESAEWVPMEAFIAEEFKETFLDIYAEDEERVLVTSIEVLSPANKRPGTKGWRLFKRKRQALLLGEANYVEIDLLRGGKRMPMRTPWPDSPYSLLVSWAERAPRCRVWPAHFRRSLPPIPVPLLEPDPDLKLDLQPLINGIFALGRYDEQLDYTRRLTPALVEEDAAWMQSLLAGRTTRFTGKGKRRS